MRHVAKISNTDERCVVAFMQIPNREDHALVVPTDTLPPRYEQAIMDLLRSAEGQNEEQFGLAMGRRLMPDTGKDILTTLHGMGVLRAVPVSQILMMPMPNQPIPLTEVLQHMGRMKADPNAPVEKFNPHLHNINAGDADQRRAIARNLMIEANIHEADARQKREKAYEYDPSLRPVAEPAAVAVPSTDLDSLLAE